MNTFNPKDHKTVKQWNIVFGGPDGHRTTLYSSRKALVGAIDDYRSLHRLGYGKVFYKEVA